MTSVDYLKVVFLLLFLHTYADVPVLSLMAICRIFTHKAQQFSTKICSHLVMTPINNLICIQMLTYIHTVQVGGFLHSQSLGVGDRW